MKSLRIWICVCALFVLLCPYTHAEDLVQSQYDALDIGKVEKAVPRTAKNLLGNLSVGDSLNFKDSMLAMFERSFDENSGVLGAGLRSALLVFSIAALCGIAGSMIGAAGNTAPVVLIAGALALTGVAAGDLHTLIGLGSGAIGEMNTFSKTLLPVLTTATVASGATAGAAMRYAAVIFCSDVVITTINNVMLPLVYAHVALVTANAATGNDSLAKLAGLVKWAITFSLKLLLTVFIAYLTVSGVISGATDAITAKTVKFAVSGAVPVVGGIMSDAAEAVLAGAAIAKNAVGVFGMLSILAIAVTPFIKIGVQYLFYKAAAAFSGVACQPELSKLIDGLGDSFGLVLGMTGACAMLLLISIFSAVAAAAPV